MDFQLLVQQLINGVSLGALYGRIVVGYTMVYGIIRLINFAHGDIVISRNATWATPWGGWILAARSVPRYQTFQPAE